MCSSATIGSFERVVLVVVFDQRVRQRLALGNAEPLADRSGGDVAHHHFDRDDLDLADQLLAHVDAADEVSRDADVRQAGEDILADAVVDHALALDRALLLRVERSGIVLEVLDDGAGLGAFVEDLGLAFVDLAAAGHIASFGRYLGAREKQSPGKGSSLERLHGRGVACPIEDRRAKANWRSAGRMHLCSGTMQDDVAEFIRCETGKAYVSDWLLVDQATIQAFADATRDWNFLHVDPQAAAADRIRHDDRPRLPGALAARAAAPGPAAPALSAAAHGGELRARASAFRPAGALGQAHPGQLHRGRASRPTSPGRFREDLDVVVEVEGSDRPAMVARWITMYFQ